MTDAALAQPGGPGRLGLSRFATLVLAAGRWFLAVLAVVLHHSLAMAVTPVSKAELPAVFAPQTRDAYRPLVGALRAYLADRQAVRGLHYLCVIGYAAGDRSPARPEGPLVWVYWREGHRLVLWEPAAGVGNAAQTLLRSRRELDLRKDVVATEEMVGTSSYLVTQAWVDSLTEDCGRRGRRYLLRVR